MPTRQRSVEKLKSLLKTPAELQTVLTTEIVEADENDIENLEQFYDLLDGMLTHIATDEQLSFSTEKFWLILNKSPNETLKTNEIFNEWIREFIMSMVDYMDSIESAAESDSFIKNSKYKIEDHVEPPSGWLTYNQFLARHVKPGKRPIKDRCNGKIIVSPAGSKYLDKRAMKDNATITVKCDTHNVHDLLAGAQYQRKFEVGIFTHSYLSVYDYHRYHTPVSGTVMEIKKIPRRTWTNEIQKLIGKTVVDDIGSQSNQTRGYIIIKTNTIGFVGVVPVRMGFVSSVNITVEEGTKLSKGGEFGYFAYGGSDIIMLFEPRAVKFTASRTNHYLVGEKIVKALS